ncbi:MAG: substrate-binding domain-containing protein, partial [Planctomycetota bacterium]
VDGGILWDAVAVQYDAIQVIEVAELSSSKATVSVGVLPFAAHPGQALRFAHYLAGRGRGQQVFADHGFKPAPLAAPGAAASGSRLVGQE